MALKSRWGGWRWRYGVGAIGLIVWGVTLTHALGDISVTAFGSATEQIDSLRGAILLRYLSWLGAGVFAWIALTLLGRRRRGGRGPARRAHGMSRFVGRRAISRSSM